MRERTVHESSLVMTRRRFCHLSGAAAAALQLGFPASFASSQGASSESASGPELYSNLLRTWCDGLLAHQVTDIADDALRGGLLCPACGLIHGRCGDAVYPLLRMARTTGDQRYVRAAIAVHEWSERQVSRSDGSWINDVTLSSWQGITVFHAIALGEALHHHGELLDAKVRAQWTDRLARAAKFLDGFISIETGNINYPVTSSYAFAICGQVLGDHHLMDRGHEMAHAALGYFTPNNILFGEGHPLTDVTPKGCRSVDLGYNVEESLPALALYSILTGDAEVKARAVAALRAHMEFLLPDGAWDNSWGSRNYKWTWWGSRTSDGCQPAFVLLSGEDARFLEAAHRNTQLMARCTHNGLLYGGPDYFAHGDLPCIHHTFTHAKAIATVLDRGADRLKSSAHASIPRDEAYGVRSFPEIGAHLVATGPWRATVTEYDWEYTEHVQAGAGGGGGGHATGGALSALFHTELGPILTASMTEYQIIELSNQQVFREGPHMTLTPRIECAGAETWTSLNDLAAVVKRTDENGSISFEATGRLQTIHHQTPASGECRYRLVYSAYADRFEIAASVEATALPALAQLIVPVVSSGDEAVTASDTRTIRVAKPHGTLEVSTDAAIGFVPLAKERTFNLVPGFECIPLKIAMSPGETIRVTLRKL